jgi:hypothetical protein
MQNVDKANFGVEDQYNDPYGHHGRTSDSKMNIDQQI